MQSPPSIEDKAGAHLIGSLLLDDLSNANDNAFRPPQGIAPAYGPTTIPPGAWDPFMSSTASFLPTATAANPVLSVPAQGAHLQPMASFNQATAIHNGANNWSSYYTPFGPVGSRAATTTNNQGASIKNITATPASKSYCDVARKTTGVLKNTVFGGGSKVDPQPRPGSHEVPLGINQVVKTSVSRRQSSSDSQSSRYGLDTFSDVDFDLRDEVRSYLNKPNSGDEKFDLNTSEELQGAEENAFKKNAGTTTTNAPRFQQISRKRSKGNGGPISAPSGKQPASQKDSGGDPNKKNRTNSRVSEPEPQLPTGDQHRFSVLLDKQFGSASPTKNVPTAVMRPNSGTSSVGGPFGDCPLLNNKMAAAFCRSQSGNRSETAYINNDLASAGIQDFVNSEKQRSLSPPRRNSLNSTQNSAGGAPFVTIRDSKGVGRKGRRRRDDGELDRAIGMKHLDLVVYYIETCVCMLIGWIRFSARWLFDLCWDITCQLGDVAVHMGKWIYLKLRVYAVRMRYLTVEIYRRWTKFLHGWTKWLPGRKGRTGSNGLGLDENIVLPNTGDEALKRLLSCQGQDAYSILGLRRDCSDEDIKRYYKRQAFLVHPDKNAQYGADEAFKVLGHAFELIGLPEQRAKYDLENIHRTQEMQVFTEMLMKLREKIEEALNTMHCDCGNKHRRYRTKRTMYEARYCRRCKEFHPARQGDIWAESTWFGIFWSYYACMDSGVFDITEWAGCQKNNLKHMKPNTHIVQYRLITGQNRHTQGPRFSEADVDDFLRQAFDNAQSGGNAYGNSGTATSIGTRAGLGHGQDYQQAADFQFGPQYNPPASSNNANRPKKGPRRRGKVPRH